MRRIRFASLSGRELGSGARAATIVGTIACALVTILGSGARGSLAFAQESPSGAFGESVEVRVVNVDVAVTDRAGNPVTDLTKSDFTLEVDGKRVEISYFARLSGAGSSAPPPATPAPPTPPAASANTPAESAAAAPPQPPTPEDSRLRLAVWFDDLHTMPAHRNRVLKQLGELLAERESEGADLLVARFDRSLEIVRNFGERGRPVADDLAKVARRAASGVFAEAARRAAFEEIDAIYANDQCGRVGDMLDAVGRYSEPLRHDSLIALNALRGAVRALAGLPGRRALVYVADGVPLVPGQEGLLYVDQLCAGKAASDQKETLVNDLQEVAEEANAAGVTFYMLQAAGLPVGGGAELSGHGLDFANEFAARANLQDPLEKLADATGGRALLDSNRLEPLIDGLARDLTSGYSLGYSPAGPPDGREHRLEVKVARAGLKVRHRDGFRDRTDVEQRNGRLLAALRFGGAANPLGVRLEIDEAKEGGGVGSLVPVRIVVPAAGVLFLGSPPEKGAARLEIALAASDEEGGLSPIRSREVTIERAKLAAGAGSLIRFPLEIRLRKGRARIAALVRDLSAQTESLVWAETAVR